jgi:hypothetical protein
VRDDRCVLGTLQRIVHPLAVVRVHFLYSSTAPAVQAVPDLNRTVRRLFAGKGGAVGQQGSTLLLTVCENGV